MLMIAQWSLGCIGFFGSHNPSGEVVCRCNAPTHQWVVPITVPVPIVTLLGFFSFVSFDERVFVQPAFQARPGVYIVNIHVMRNALVW